MPANPTLADRREQLIEDRRGFGAFSIASARGDVIRAMAYLDMPQTRGAHELLGRIADLLDQAKSEVGR